MTAWLLAIAIFVLSVVPASLRPETAAPHNYEHFAAFFVTGIAFGLGYNRRPTLLALTLAFFSGLIEIVQIFVPDRHARLSDFIVDACAVCVGVAAAAFASRRIFANLRISSAN